MTSIEEKVGQMMMVGFDGLEAPPYILQWLNEGRAGSVILFERNVENPRQLAELTQSLHEAAAYPLLIAMDQEGGTAARLREGFTESPGAMALGAADSEILAEEIAVALASEMRSLGINWNLAPVVDITQSTQNPALGTRSLGANTRRVSSLAVAQIQGFQKVGVAATTRHFPGMGSTVTDPEINLPVTEYSLERLWERDLVPFRAALEAGVAAVLVGTLQVKAIEPDYPSCLSPVVIHQLLRETMGFGGLVVTDCLELRAVMNYYPPGMSAVLAAQAGASVLRFSHTVEHQLTAFTALARAAKSGELPEEQIDAALESVITVKENFAITEAPSTTLIRHPQHLIVAQEAARAAIATVRADIDTLPLEPQSDRSIGLVEFESAAASFEPGQLTMLANLLRQEVPRILTAALDHEELENHARQMAFQLASDCDLLIVATRNAHLIPAQLELAYELIRRAQKSILLCLRNPFDATELSHADTILCTCGDSIPSLQAVVEVLMGHMIPTARLPVPIPIDL